MKIKKNKYLIKFIVISSILLIMMTTLQAQSRERIVLKDEVGSREELEDISVVYGSEYSMFDNTEVVLDKNGLSTQTKNREEIYNDYVDMDMKNLDITETYTRNLIYSNDVYIGSVNFYSWEDETTIEIKNRHKETNIDQFIGITIDTKSIYEYAYLENVFIDNDDIYMVFHSSDYEAGEICKFIGKVNLKEQKFEFLDKIKLKDGVDEDYLSEMVFIHNDKIYIQVKGYFNLDEASNGYFYYTIYDIKSREIKSLDVEKLNNKVIADYYIEDDKLNIIYVNPSEKDILEHTQYELENLTEVYNKVYHIGDTFYDVADNDGLITLKVVNNKIYLLTSNNRTLSMSEDGTDEKYRIESNHPINIKVFDIKKDKVVYEAKLTNNDQYKHNFVYLVKNYE